jgi:hypothetical protein
MTGLSFCSFTFHLSVANSSLLTPEITFRVLSEPYSLTSGHLNEQHPVVKIVFSSSAAYFLGESRSGLLLYIATLTPMVN